MNKVINLIFSIILLSLSSFSFADFKSVAKDAFANTLTGISTGSSAGSDAGRMGYYAGASIQVRQPTVNITPVHVTAPSFSAGCNGIDANFGAISFIDGDDIKNLLRAVVANGTSYAFGLAMEAICGSCFTNMKDLAQKINEMSASIKDSCTLATNLVDGSIDAVNAWSSGDLAKKKGQVASYSKGAGANLEEEEAWWSPGGLTGTVSNKVTGLAAEYAAWNPGTDFYNVITPKSEDASKDMNTSPNIARLYIKNIIYEAAQSTDIHALMTLTTGTAATDKIKDYEYIMSLTGTKIFYTNKNGSFSNVDVRKTIDWTEILDTTIEEINVMNCREMTTANTPDVDPLILGSISGRCMYMSPYDTYKIKNPIVDLKDELDRIVDLIAMHSKERGTTTTISPEVKQFMKMDTLGISALLTKANTRSQSYITSIVKEKVTPLMAELIVISMYEKIAEAIKHSSMGSPDKTSKALVEGLIEKIGYEFRSAHMDIYSEYGGIYEELVGMDRIYDQLLQNKKDSMAMKSLTNLSGIN